MPIVGLAGFGPVNLDNHHQLGDETVRMCTIKDLFLFDLIAV